MRRVLQLSGFGAEEIASALEPWDPTHQPEPSAEIAWGAAITTGTAIAAGEGVARSLVLLGDPGVGKTKTACMAAAAYVRAGGEKLFFANAPLAVEAVLDERREGSGRSRTEGRILAARLLILDEVGGEAVGFKAGVVDRWVLEWYRRGGYLLVTSNATDLDQIGDGRLASRLGSGDITLLTSGVDYREVQAERRCAAVGGAA